MREINGSPCSVIPFISLVRNNFALKDKISERDVNENMRVASKYCNESGKYMTCGIRGLRTNCLVDTKLETQQAFSTGSLKHDRKRHT